MDSATIQVEEGRSLSKQASDLPVSTERLQQSLPLTAPPFEPSIIDFELHSTNLRNRAACLLAGPRRNENDPLPRPVFHSIEPSSFRISQSTPIPDIINFFTRDQGVRDLTEDLIQATMVSVGPMAHGGVADIYQAILPNGTKVAVKCLRQTTRSESTEVKRASRELAAWSKLEHNNVLAFLGLALFNGRLAMVSPWVEPGNVIAVLSQDPTLDRYRLNTQLASAIVYLHRDANVIHGDLKGDNVLYSEDGRIKLTDFGLAIVESQTWILSQTDPGGGTLRWMAPELITEEGRRSKEADIYAMGMTMLEILTGRVPFQEIRSAFGIINAVVQRKEIPARPDTILAQSRRGLMLWAVLVRCWSYYPKERAKAEEIEVLMSLLGPD
ncbi:kinase domain protein [Ceratobasidium sp. AG-Ba]|nr:kinase domain protein [Ceratobasidium sp. AG-Ba]